jgi:hypothetical protein
MGISQITKQVTITDQATVNPSQTLEEVAFFTPSGQQVTPGVILVTATSALISTAAKTTTSPVPPKNSIIAVTFTVGNNAASPTLNFNGTGAKNILLGGTAPTGAEATFGIGGVGLFFYDGTSLHQMGVYS